VTLAFELQEATHIRILAFARYAVAICVAAALLGACSKVGASDSARHATATTAPVSATAPTAMPTWPGYVAIDYGKPGQPSLTLADASRVQWALSKVKACQRPLVRYALPGGSGPVVLFFAIPPNSGAHVFGEGDAYYVPTEDSVIPMPGDSEDYGLIQKEGIRWDIAGADSRCRSPERNDLQRRGGVHASYSQASTNR
jgi:hypothetical protein